MHVLPGYSVQQTRCEMNNKPLTMLLALCNSRPYPFGRLREYRSILAEGLIRMCRIAAYARNSKIKMYVLWRHVHV